MQTIQVIVWDRIPVAVKINTMVGGGKKLAKIPEGLWYLFFFSLSIL